MSTPQTTEFYIVGHSHSIVQIFTWARRDERSRWREEEREHITYMFRKSVGLPDYI